MRKCISAVLADQRRVYFSGMEGDYTNVTGNRTITASYKIRTFTVTFDSNGALLLHLRPSLMEIKQVRQLIQ